MTTEAEQREIFEERMFNRRFLSSIMKVGTGCMTFQSVACPTKAEFVAKDENGDYLDQTLNAMWFAWCQALTWNPPEAYYHDETITKEPTLMWAYDKYKPAATDVVLIRALRKN
jgi:hypothetical protein